MNDKFMCTSNYNKQNYPTCRLRSMEEKLASACLYQPSKYLIELTKDFKLTNKENVYQYSLQSNVPSLSVI